MKNRTLAMTIRLFVMLACLLANSTANSGYSTIKAGEHGGGKNKDGITECPPGYVIRGLKIRAGTYIHELNIFCQQVIRGTLSGEVTQRNSPRTNAVFQPLIAEREKQVFCPDNYRLSGIKVQAGSWLDRINSVRCTRFNGTHRQFRNVGIGGTGGTTHRLYCDAGQDDYITKFKFRVGEWIDQVQAICE